MKKIYISEKTYQGIVEDKESVSSARAKIKGIIHHITPFMKMSDEELDDLIQSHDWLDEQLTQIETIAENIGHFAEYEWEYFDGDDERLNEKEKVSPTRKKCRGKAKRKYDVWPSAYASGYVEKCVKRGGNIN